MGSLVICRMVSGLIRTGPGCGYKSAAAAAEGRACWGGLEGGRILRFTPVQVNQKMMKSTLIKDLYGEIDRLKAELNANREKNGVYIPKERYSQEESERKKAMAEQIEQMGILLETNQKQLEDMQEKYNTQLQHASDLSKQLDATERSLNHTNKLLSTAKEDLKQSQYILREKNFIISEQKKAENALAHQACVLQADLEKSLHDNASLFSKIGLGCTA